MGPLRSKEHVLFIGRSGSLVVLPPGPESLTNSHRHFTSTMAPLTGGQRSSWPSIPAKKWCWNASTRIVAGNVIHTIAVSHAPEMSAHNLRRDAKLPPSMLFFMARGIAFATRNPPSKRSGYMESILMAQEAPFVSLPL